MGSDYSGDASLRIMLNFNPRSPDGERLPSVRPHTPIRGISIHAPRMGSDLPAGRGDHHRQISIHAPRMGSDAFMMASNRLSGDFNPRSPDGERQTTPSRHTQQWDFNPRSPDGERLNPKLWKRGIDPFQSTLPGWGATAEPGTRDAGRQHFNPRSPDGERRTLRADTDYSNNISIHAPRMGSDVINEMTQQTNPVFQSTLPGWGATSVVLGVHSAQEISIHAPRMGSDRYESY